jgi:hypothetical protein
MKTIIIKCLDSCVPKWEFIKNFECDVLKIVVKPDKSVTIAQKVEMNDVAVTTQRIIDLGWVFVKEENGVREFIKDRGNYKLFWYYSHPYKISIRTHKGQTVYNYGLIKDMNTLKTILNSLEL